MGARHIVQSHFIPEKDVTVQGNEIILDPATAMPLEEAVHHFKASLGLIAIDALMGHPRPVRPTLENSSIPFTQVVGSQKTNSQPAVVASFPEWILKCGKISSMISEHSNIEDCSPPHNRLGSGSRLSPARSYVNYFLQTADQYGR